MRHFYALFLIALWPLVGSVLAGERHLIDNDWRFHLGDVAGAERPGFNDDGWRRVELPHDWGIEAPTAADAPAGGAGGYHQAGVGWYRHTLDLAAAKRSAETLLLEFDGVYRHAQVWLNGELLGSHAYGYTPFSFDITDHVRDDWPNVVAVRVDNSAQPNCRWYSGSGIYRHVWLRTHGEIAINPTSVWTHTAEAGSDQARVAAHFAIENDSGKKTPLQALVRLLNDTGKVVAEATHNCVTQPDEANEQLVTLEVPQPRLWSPDLPQLYTLSIRLTAADGQDESPLDRHSQRCGLRTISLDSRQGLLLNGEPVILYGGNVHHDHGPLGAASFDDAERRRVQILKSAGFNAVRTSHNPPAEAFLDACDEFGLLVVDEAFDGWKKHKVPYDYGSDFDENWRGDLAAMVRRDRRHSSVIMWSIGNEMYERGDESGARLSHDMTQFVKSLDATRPVTAGVNGLGPRPWSDLDRLFAPLDVVGYNYEIARFAEDHKRLAGRVMMTSESYPADALASWRAVTTQPWVVGDFVWSAIDYLGEAGIGRVYPPGETLKAHWEADHFPWRGAACGDIDLLGHRKPISHYRQIVWDRGAKLGLAVTPPSGGDPWQPTLWGVKPAEAHWTWNVPQGEPLQVQVYSRWPRVRLELNGQVVGEAATGAAQAFRAEFDVLYEPGELIAIGLDSTGTARERKTLKSAGPAARLALSPSRGAAPADRQSLVYLDVEVVDAAGQLQPQDDRMIRIQMAGPATIQAVGNANLLSQEAYRGSESLAFHGRGQCVLRGTGRPGAVIVTVEADGLPEAQATIEFVEVASPAS